MAKIVVACGSGIVTSQTVASKVAKLLDERGITADVIAVEKSDLKSALRDADAYLAIAKSSETYPVPTFNGVAFLTGMGQDEEFEKLVRVVAHR